MITTYLERNFLFFNKLIVIRANIKAKILKVLNIYFIILEEKILLLNLLIQIL